MQGLQEVKDNKWLSAMDSIGYALCTRAVVKNIFTFASEGNQSQKSRCDINRLFFAAGTRQPFRESYYALSGLFVQSLMTAAFWGVVTVIRVPFCWDVSKTGCLFKEFVIVAITNLACQIISFVGMCRPKWGVSLWLYTTSKIFQHAGTEAVDSIANGVTRCFKELHPSLLYNLGKKKVEGLDKSCSNLEAKAKKIKETLKASDFFTKLENSNVLEDRALEIFSRIVELTD